MAGVRGPAPWACGAVPGFISLPAAGLGPCPLLPPPVPGLFCWVGLSSGSTPTG